MPLPFEPERFDSILADEAPPPIPWLVENLIPQGCRLLWISDPGVGKSLLALDLALAVGSGQPFLTHRILNPGPVLYFDEENAASFLRQRVYGLAHGRKLDKVDHFLHLFRFKMRSRPVLDWGRDMALIVRELSPSLIILDTLLWFSGRAVQGKENDSALMGAVMGTIGAILATHPSATFLVLHHLPKDPFARNTPRGSGVIAGDCDGYWTLSRSRGGDPKAGEIHPCRLTPGKSRILDAVPSLTIKPTRDGKLYRLSLVSSV